MNINATTNKQICSVSLNLNTGPSVSSYLKAK